DQDLGDGHFRRREMGDQRLVGEVLVQRLFACQRPLQGVFVAVEAAAALAGLGPVDHRAFGGVGRGGFALAHHRLVVAIDVGGIGVEIVIGDRGVAIVQFEFAGFVFRGGRLGLGGAVGGAFAVLA